MNISPLAMGAFEPQIVEVFLRIAAQLIERMKHWSSNKKDLLLKE